MDVVSYGGVERGDQESGRALYICQSGAFGGDHRENGGYNGVICDCVGDTETLQQHHRHSPNTRLHRSVVPWKRRERGRCGPFHDLLWSELEGGTLRRQFGGFTISPHNRQESLILDSVVL